MKKISFYILSLVILVNCENASNKKNIVLLADIEELTLPQKLSSSTIYEVNIRQFTPEGTFNAFSNHLPRLKELGVDVLWLMPIHPISKANRKGTLGSYYAPQDYKGVNPEFGTIDDFNVLLKKAHDMGFYMILDWVPNHTGRDHKWITEHPEYYITDHNGDVTYESMSPTDVWWDTALLNNINPNTRKAMIDAMRFWVELGVDGFRLDHGCGDKIPLYLWEEARAALDPIKDLFWLAECGHETFILDGSYADEFEIIMREVVEGKQKGNALSDWIENDMFKYGRSALRMTYTSNHDLNSWVGTTSERFGKAHQSFATFIFTSYGFPLILGGQEVGLDKRLEFFEKDTINWNDPKDIQSFYKSLVKLKKENPALWAGDAGGFPLSIENNENVVAFTRRVEGNEILGVFNFSSKNQSVEIINEESYGTFLDYFSNKNYSVNNRPIKLKPWEYMVLIKK